MQYQYKRFSPAQHLKSYQFLGVPTKEGARSLKFAVSHTHQAWFPKRVLVLDEFGNYFAPRDFLLRVLNSKPKDAATQERVVRDFKKLAAGDNDDE